MRKITTIFIAVFLCFQGQQITATEGMWLPLLLESLNQEEMQAMGMKLTAEDIYSVNKGSLKDAIVHFGGFCTSEVISPNGLLLTNHHCGYRQIQSHTTLKNNYLKDGFWAKTKKDELANPGLFAKFIVRIEDVSSKILNDVTDELSEKERQSQIDKNIEALKSSVKLEKFEEISIRPFFKGNQYFMFVTVTYNDVRLVGTPPESIGKFGADTDNWVWPRHTGDFALFRIYADKDNNPAEYSEDNIPYTPKHYLPISVDGVDQDDFTMVFGFPGRTNQYLPSYAVEQIVDVLNPAKIAIRDKALKILDTEMRADPATKIQYASKFASIANYWKKWIGESQGLKTSDGVGRKKKFEAEFSDLIGQSTASAKKYAHLLPQFEKLYKEIEPFALKRDYYNEVAGRNVELLSIVNYLNRLKTNFEESGEEGYNGYLGRLKPFLKNKYKDYNKDIDKKVFASLVEMYDENAGLGPKASTIKKKYGSYELLAGGLYGMSTIADGDKMMALLEESPETVVKRLAEDPAFKFGAAMREHYNENVSKQYNDIEAQINNTQRNYMAALIDVFPKRRFYPDANGTMRVSYGQVSGYAPKDGMQYLPVTYLKGVMQKYVPGDYEFDVPKKLIELYEKKDYGEYHDDGKMPVCFIGSNHTTGGNSGSPAIDAHGNLIGLNFDRVWEGTMSDINYDKSICRNIMVDIRYVLFIIDKFGDSKHLVDEMTLVHPKKGK